ncbi:DUF4291 domain-containing protein [Kineosporia sp. J2-2]|uniref:DUF4291 domain-containing protein n=1 Tax=Kineosporia corallincola TaxID=2835133 RepID=A0ABS5TGH3_9ACTN|nr:DUF4291 domain-containing protein [Kineosporia corallincola]MBT0769958.1 DUF4291 domain-containing protein [Kineosporia corallincola]
METPLRQIRAIWDATTITVYQAYSPEIAEPALAAGRFVAPFRRGRMTWVKPSFLWMMYRSDWATAPGQERVLAVRLTREGFARALAGAALSSYDPAVHADREAWSRELKRSSVRVQWDPERSLTMQRLPHRSLQLGLSGGAVDRYVDEWITGLTDVTATAHAVHELVRAGDLATARTLLPAETPIRSPTPWPRALTPGPA